MLESEDDIKFVSDDLYIDANCQATKCKNKWENEF